MCVFESEDSSSENNIRTIISADSRTTLEVLERYLTVLCIVNHVIPDSRNCTRGMVQVRWADSCEGSKGAYLAGTLVASTIVGTVSPVRLRAQARGQLRQKRLYPESKIILVSYVQ